jgi:sugar phosphate isomerase/epimerase
MDFNKDIGLPQVALCNIFEQDSEMLANFAFKHRFECIDWSVDPYISDRDFFLKMDLLRDFEVRYHCRFFDVDFAFADKRSEEAMEILRRIIHLVSAINGKYMTVHIGLGQTSDEQLDWGKAVGNLSDIVSYGLYNGITVCLENITTVWTSNPKFFKSLIEETGAGITLDIGHIHVCQERLQENNLCKKFIYPHTDRVFNSHIYHTETAGIGHVAPKNLDQIVNRLEFLISETNCNWWVIELSKPDEILKTRDILVHYFNLLQKTAP